MSQKNNKKKHDFKELKKSIAPILVVNQNKLRPYIELFEYAPENIFQQPLGILTGFFKINDESEDSAYIVNFLASVLKKEYFLNPKRSVTNSLDAALHKLNLALSELAKHGNIRWLGKLEAAICVLEKNTVHFSTTGGAKVALIRNQSINIVSDDIPIEDLDLHPLKTFTEVSSGRLENNDKLLVTSLDIFNIFSLSEIKKSAFRFTKEKFSQFLRTALVNELVIAGTIIIDVFEQEEPEEKAEKKKMKQPEKEILNAFSEKTFQKEKKITEQYPPPRVAREQEEEKEYVDKKTGHIYIQGENLEIGRNSQFHSCWLITEEKSNDLFFWTKNKFKKLLFKVNKKIKEIREKAERKRQEQKNAEKEEDGPKFSPEEITPSVEQKIIPVRPEAKEKEEETKNPPALFGLSFNVLKTKLSGIGKTDSLKFSKKFNFKLLIPDFEKIKRMIATLDYQQKIYGLIILIAIIVVPLLFIGKKEQTPANVSEPIARKEDLSQKLLGDKNIIISTHTEIIFHNDNLVSAHTVDGKLLAVMKDKIINMENKEQEFIVPSGTGNITMSAPMSDLKLLLLLTDKNKIISFSPVSREIKENNIEIPQNSQIKGMASYLTYLYLLDARNNQIYRYPRAEGGFGQKTNWIKENTDISNSLDIAIDDNIYVASKERITKFFKGKIQEFSLEQSNTPVEYGKIFTDDETANLYALDGANARLVKFSKNGEITAQYYNERLLNAKDFSVDEKNNKAYFITSSNDLISLDL